MPIRFLVATLAVLLPFPAQAEDPVFEALPFIGRAWGLSADGSIVVGSDFTFDLRDGTVTPLLAPVQDKGVFAQGISGDGRVAVGASQVSDHGDPEGFRREGVAWREGVPTLLGELPGGEASSVALDASSDGSVIVGRSVGLLVRLERFRNQPVRWDNGVLSALPCLPVCDGEAFAVSSDGSVAVGTMGNEAFRSEGGITEGLGFVTPLDLLSGAWGVSADGSLVVGLGISFQAGGGGPFLWKDREMIPLDPGHTVGALAAFGVAMAGPVVVGQGFIWDPIHGARSLRDYLVNELGLDLGEFDRLEARAISDDGTVIVGNEFPNGRPWMARVPPLIPVAIDIRPTSDRNIIRLFDRGLLSVAILGSDEFDISTVDTSRLEFGPAWTRPVHREGGHYEDVNKDGYPDFVSHYRVSESGLSAADTQACVVGGILGSDLLQFYACDHVEIR